MEFRLSECTVLILKTGKVIRGVGGGGGGGWW